MQEKLELIEWFQLQYSSLVQAMKICEHTYMEEGLAKPNQYHLEGDIWTHTCMVYNEAKKYEDNFYKAAALLHDIGKIPARFQENGKTKFHNHESYSTFMSVDILKHMQLEGYINSGDVQGVLWVISNHGRIHDVKVAELDKYFSYRSVELLTKLINFVKCDSDGRLSSVGRQLTFDYFKYNDAKYNIMSKTDPEDKKLKLTVLVGPPCSGKSTYRYGNLTDSVVISRDNLMMKLYGDRGTYSEVFKLLSKEEHKNIDSQLLNNYTDALKEGRNITIDMTNMSKKSRAKWLNGHKELKDYTKEAAVFIISLNTFEERNNIRKETGKNISAEVYANMISSFTMPLNDEFDKVYIAI